MKNLTLQQLFEVDRCFQHVLEHITRDNVPPRSVLFGSTVDNWFRQMRGERPAGLKIVLVGRLPNAAYEGAYIRNQFKGKEIIKKGEKHG